MIVNMKIFSVLINFAALAHALSRTSAPSGALVVGSGQKYTTSERYFLFNRHTHPLTRLCSLEGRRCSFSFIYKRANHLHRAGHLQRAGVHS
jgi:hypothetical protein